MSQALAQRPPRAKHFANARVERRSDFLGMWLFLATEVMMFGALFMGIAVYRITESQAMAEAAGHLDMWLGGADTAILLTSSLTMGLAVVSARQGRVAATARRLALTAALGVVFLLVKAFEYHKEYTEGLMPGIGPPFPLEPRVTEMFYNLYFAGTGLHALHLGIGIALVGLLAARVARRSVPLPDKRITVETVGLYWHFVDVVWIFLYPVLYLAGR